MRAAIGQASAAKPANLTTRDLSNFDLGEIDFKGANLAGANLFGANLSGANLTGSNLTDANLAEADLDGTILTGRESTPERQSDGSSQATSRSGHRWVSAMLGRRAVALSHRPGAGSRDVARLVGLDLYGLVFFCHRFHRLGIAKRCAARAAQALVAQCR